MRSEPARGSTAEVAGRALGLGQPLPVGRRTGGGLLRSLQVTPRPGPGRPILEAVDLSLQLGGGVLGAGPGLGVGTPPALVLGRPDGTLDGPQPVLQRSDLVA